MKRNNETVWPKDSLKRDFIDRDNLEKFFPNLSFQFKI